MLSVYWFFEYVWSKHLQNSWGTDWILQSNRLRLRHSISERVFHTIYNTQSYSGSRLLPPIINHVRLPTQPTNTTWYFLVIHTDPSDPCHDTLPYHPTDIPINTTRQAYEVSQALPLTGSKPNIGVTDSGFVVPPPARPCNRQNEGLLRSHHCTLPCEYSH